MRISRYILWQLFTALGLFLLAIGGILWLVQIVPLIDQIVLKGEPGSTFVRLAPLLIPNIIRMILPIAALGGTLYVFNKLMADSELVVMSATGRSPLQITKPVIGFGLLICLFLYVLSFYISPAANRSIRGALNEIETNFDRNIIIPRVFNTPTEKFTIFAKESLTSGELLNIFIEDRATENQIRAYSAARAFWTRETVNAKIIMHEGQIITTNTSTNEVTVSNFDRLEIEVSGFADQRPRSMLPEEKPNAQLISELNDSDKRGQAISELLERATFPLLAFLLPVFGATYLIFRGYSRQGNRETMAVATLVGIFAEANYLFAKSAVTENPSLFPIVFIPAILLIFISLQFYRRATKPKRI